MVRLSEGAQQKTLPAASGAKERVKILFDAMRSKDVGVLQSQLLDVAQRMESLDPVEVMAVLRLTSSVREQLRGWGRAVEQAAGYFERRGMNPKQELMGLIA